MNITPVLGVPTLIIESNVRKEPTVWADEARHEIMTKVILSAPLPMDPVQREMALANRAKFEQAIFNVLEPVFRRCITAERMRVEKES